MEIFDVNEIPTEPNSDLDSDLSRARNLVIAGEKTVSIAPGDWADIDPGAIAPDEDWGFSFQVCGFDTVNNIDYVLCLVKNPNTGDYEPTAFSLPLVTNAFRRNSEIEE